MNTIELDGSTGEGGGQILRTALALSVCTGQPIKIDRIRAKRPKPGLMRQHLTCVRAAAAVCGARVRGAELGSRQLAFEPGAVRAGEHEFSIGSAGSCMLVLQTVLPPLMLADGASRLTLRGGTHNPMAPPYHFIERAFAPLLRRLGARIDLALHRHGFVPAGGGEVEVRIGGIGATGAGALTPFDLIERGEPGEHYAECLSPGLPHAVADRELAALGRALGWPRDQLRAPAVPQHEGPGNVLMATLAHANVCEVFTAFGEKSVSSERVAATLARETQAWLASRAALGPWLADQWMLPLALAVARQGGAGQGGAAEFTCSELTEHATTNMRVIEQFLPVQWHAEKDADCWRVRVAAT
jgi:RNA 3'-terminal phosphate cyclase (ATP)